MLYQPSRPAENHLLELSIVALGVCLSSGISKVALLLGVPDGPCVSPFAISVVTDPLRAQTDTESTVFSEQVYILFLQVTS